MAEEQFNVKMRLVSVSEVSFMMSPNKVGENVNPEAIQIGFSSQIIPEVDNEMFGLVFGIRYEFESEVVLESLYKFVFEVKELKKFIEFKDDGSITVNHLMPHFLSVAVGTLRGILVVKTAGTVFSKLPLPMIDINQLYYSLSRPRP